MAKIGRRASFAILANLLAVAVGIVELTMLENSAVHAVLVLAVTFALIGSVFCDPQNLIRPYSFFVISFLIFVWVKFPANLFMGTQVITVGRGVTTAAVHKTAAYLGICMCLMCSAALAISEVLCRGRGIAMLEDARHITLDPVFSKLFFMAGLIFFGLFVYDSYIKIPLINQHNYLAISENVMLEGYTYFTLGKWALILWALTGKSKNRFFIACTVFAAAAAGYLMRGARGYSITYVFLWLMFFALRRRIKFTFLAAAAVGLLLLADFILSYRLGFQVADGFANKILATLVGQGVSVEPVFGAITFHGELRHIYPIADLFSRSDFGIYVDRIRVTGFEAGGFGTSFFAEAFFAGFPVGILFAALFSVCVGIMEYAYKAVRKSSGAALYAQILLFMTTPNLIYFARSGLHDYIFKTLSTLAIIAVLWWTAQNRIPPRDVIERDAYKGGHT